MATIKEVAKAAGVSTATVSRVLNNSPAVRPETILNVRKTISELGYKPNVLAAQMRTQETKTIIVIVPDISNNFFSEIIYGIESAANANGYQVLIADLKGSANNEEYYLQAIQKRQFDGVISLSASVAKRLIEKIASQYPVVVANQYLENCNVPDVTIDNKSAAMAITEHLIDLGHRRIGHITADPSMLLYRDRMNGYISALAKHGIPIDLESVIYGESSIMSGFNAMNRLLDLDKGITAVFAAGDIMAIGAMNAIKKRGLRVPEDIAIAGFDDIEMSAFTEPPLSTVRQPKRKIGEMSFLKLNKLMKHQPLDNVVNVLEYELVIRGSSGRHEQ